MADLKALFNKKSIKLFILANRTKIIFLVVGGWNTLFGFLVFVILYKLFSKVFDVDYFAYTSAQVLGTFLSILNAYIGHKYFTFQSTVKGRKMIMEFIRFSATYMVTFVLALLLMPFLVEVLHINPILSAILLNVIVVLTSYFAHSRFSFTRKT